jgi:sec-independent protein translocase protein TatB
MMNRMSFSETIFLFVLALVIFGPKKLPEIARQAGKLLSEFRRASNEFKAQIEQEIANLEVENRRQTILPPGPPVEGTASRTLNGALSGASQTIATSSDAGGTDTTLAEAPATPANAEDEPLFATAEPPTSAAAASEVLPDSDAVASSISRESHA